MALKRPSTTLLRLPTSSRALHSLHKPILPIPRPTPFVPDAATFLTLIGRNLSSHAAKIPSWEALFTLSSAQLKEAGLEPARARRYLLWWRTRYRAGIMGIGGDCAQVRDGVAELRIAEVASRAPRDARATVSRSAGTRRVVVNVPPTVALPEDPAAAEKQPEGDAEGGIASVQAVDLEDATVVKQVRIAQGFAIAGTGVQPVKGHVGVARLKVQEGLWEQKQGHKVDGGERRQAEVRYKRKVAEKKAR